MSSKNIFSSLISAIYMLSFGLPAVATEAGKVESAILFNCNVSFHATGRSAYLVLGYTNIEGAGMMMCYDFLQNVVEEIPLKVTIKGPGAGLGITGLNVSGGQAGIGLNSSPDALLGKYLVVRGNAAVGIGGAASTGIRISKGAFNISVQLESTSGLGAGLDLLTFELERDSKRTVSKTAMPIPPKELEASAPEAQVTTIAATPSAVPTVVRVQTSQVVELVDEQGKVINRYQFLRK